MDMPTLWWESIRTGVSLQMAARAGVSGSHPSRHRLSATASHFPLPSVHFDFLNGPFDMVMFMYIVGYPGSTMPPRAFPLTLAHLLIIASSDILHITTLPGSTSMLPSAFHASHRAFGRLPSHEPEDLHLQTGGRPLAALFLGRLARRAALYSRMPTKLDVRVKLSPPPPPSLGGFGVFSLSVEVTGGTGDIPLEVFIFQKDVSGEFSSSGDDSLFYSIATPDQIESIPLNAGGGPAGMGDGFYRASSVTLIFQTSAEAISVRDKILGDISKLCKGWDLAADTSSMESEDYSVDADGFSATT